MSIITVLGMAVLAVTGFVAIPATPANTVSTNANAIAGSPQSLKDCPVCEVLPAVPTTTTKKNASSSSSKQVTIIAKKTLTEQVSQYQKARKVVVGFNVMPKGLPKAKQGTCRTGDAAWSEWQTIHGVVQAPAGHHGKTTACLVNGVWRQIGGKDQWNCGNPVKWMGQQPFARVPIVKHIVVFRTVKAWNSTYHEWVHKSAKSSSTSSTTTTYSCSSLGSGWTLGSENGQAVCKKCPPPCPTTVQTTTTVATTTTTPPPPPANRPPTGILKVPQHLIAGGQAGKVSVDGLSDPDGDHVTVTFTFKDANGNTLSLATGPTFSDGSGVISQMINPPKTPMNVYVYALLDDGKTNGQVTLPVGSFPVVADPDPSK